MGTMLAVRAGTPATAIITWAAQGYIRLRNEDLIPLNIRGPGVDHQEPKGNSWAL